MTRRRESLRVLELLDLKPRLSHNVTRFAGGLGHRKRGRRKRSLGYGLPLTAAGMGRGSSRRRKR